MSSNAGLLTLRKWYFSLNEEAGPDFEAMARAAVRSCLRNTHLQPHCLYAGSPNAFTAWLQDHQVKVVFHRAAFLEPLIAAGRCDQAYGTVARGAFLRVEVPRIEQEDRLVLYTDVDVIFLEDLAGPQPLPRLFACAPQFLPTDYSYLNSGVMLVHVPRMRDEYGAFVEYIRAEFPRFEAYDQGAFNTFFRGRWDQLSPLWNWKPYWGVHEQAKILHFHGPKPRHIEEHLAGGVASECALIRTLLALSPEGNRRALELFRRFDRDAEETAP